MTAAATAITLDKPVTETDHVRGDLDAPVTLVEYGEFECPVCGRAYHLLNDVMQDAAGTVRLVFRHFARDDVHPFSERSAEAAEAAGAQGRFWEMHDFLFMRQHQLEYRDLVRYADDMGLDVERFEREVIDHAHLPKVRAHLQSGIESGVTSTPTFFINGVRYTGAIDHNGLLAAIRSHASAIA